MLRITVEYHNTNISRDAGMGWEWMQEQTEIDNRYIAENYSDVMVLNQFPNDFVSNKEVCELIFAKLNRISTDDLKSLPGYKATFIQDTVDVDRTDTGHIGHTSMSVGDIVTIEDKDSLDRRVYFCDDVGFKDVTRYLVYGYWLTSII